MRPIMSGLLIFILLYLLADFFVKYASIGLFSETLTHTLLGNADEFLDPITQASFLEHLHTETFFLMMILLTLSAVFMRLWHTTPFALILLNITMLSALLSLLALALSYYSSIGFINLYVVSYFTWHLGAIFMSISSLYRLYFD